MFCNVELPTSWITKGVMEDGPLPRSVFVEGKREGRKGRDEYHQLKG